MIGVPEDIPEVSESMGIAPGPPVIVLGGRVVVVVLMVLVPWDGAGVVGVTPGVVLVLVVVLVVVLVLVVVPTGVGELEGLVFCLWTSWI